MNKSLQRLGYCEKALTLKNEIEDNFLLLAEYLYNIKEHSMYEPQWSSFEEYVEELKMSTTNVNRLIQIHKTFIMEYGFSSKEVITAGGSSVLGEIMPQIHSRSDAIHWMRQSATLTRKHLREELLEAKSGILQTKCDHDMYHIQICRNCGMKETV